MSLCLGFKKIWSVKDGDKQWLIYDHKRHHIFNNATIERMKKGRKGKAELNFKTVTKAELEKYVQGDVFDLKGKLE